MAWETWAGFTLAAMVLLAIPGPTILLVISYALGHGPKATRPLVAGVALGDFTAMTASMLGLGAILSTSAVLYTGLKWAGAAYLIYLGVKLWRAPVALPETGAGAANTTKPLRMFWHTYTVTTLNPKGILFFMAFLPQFLDHSQPLAGQIMIFEATFLTLAILNASLYAALASAARRTIRRPGVQRTVNRLGGGLMIGAGTVAVGWQK